MIKRLKRGVAIEYALIVMIIVMAFTAVIVSASVSSNIKANEYNDYVTQKAHVDEIGALCKIYYVNGADNLTDITDAADDYGFTFTYAEKDTATTDGDVLTATVTDSDETLLTMQFTYESSGDSFTLTAYVYGEI